MGRCERENRSFLLSLLEAASWQDMGVPRITSRRKERIQRGRSVMGVQSVSRGPEAGSQEQDGRGNTCVGTVEKVITYVMAGVRGERTERAEDAALTRGDDLSGVA